MDISAKVPNVHDIIKTGNSPKAAYAQKGDELLRHAAQSKFEVPESMRYAVRKRSRRNLSTIGKTVMAPSPRDKR